MSLHPHQHIVFSDFVIFYQTQIRQVVPHFNIGVSLTANVVEHLFNDLVIVQISLYVNYSLIYFPYFTPGFPFLFLFIFRYSSCIEILIPWLLQSLQTSFPMVSPVNFVHSVLHPIEILNFDKVKTIRFFSLTYDIYF